MGNVIFISFSPAVLQYLPSPYLPSPWLIGKEVILWDPDGNTMEANELPPCPYAGNSCRHGRS